MERASRGVGDERKGLTEGPAGVCGRALPVELPQACICSFPTGGPLPTKPLLTHSIWAFTHSISSSPYNSSRCVIFGL